jgi:hypothetical protein
MIAVVGNSMEHFSTLWATTQKKVGIEGNNVEELPQSRTV